MRNKVLKKAHASFVLQHDSSDCGIACLLSIVKYYKGDTSVERLRELSGTNRDGTTLLGLYQAATHIGFNSEAYEADIDSVIKHNQPVILHVSIPEGDHYVVLYGYDGHNFIIGDPAKDIQLWSMDTLDTVWQSKYCLLLYPNDSFQLNSSIKKKKWNWVISLIREDYSILLISAIMGIVIAVLGLTMAIFSQKLIDDILPNKDLSKLWVGTVLLLFLLTARTAVFTLRQYFLLRQEKAFNKRIISLFYDHLLFLPKMFFDNRKTGDIVARLNDTRRIQSVIFQLFSNTIIDVFIVSISLLFLFLYSTQISLIVIGPTLLLFYIMHRHGLKITKMQQNVMNSYALSENNFIESVQGFTTIKHYNKQYLFDIRNKKIYGEYINNVFNLGLVNTRLTCLSSICTIVILGSILSYGSMLVLNNEMLLGELMAILTVMNTMIPSIISLALVITSVKEAKVALNRIFEFIHIETENKHIIPPPISEERIESISFQNVSFRFPGKPLLLKNISLKIERGKITWIIGESGSGKSTISNLLSRLYSIDSGIIMLNQSRSIHRINLKTWRSFLGVAAQDTYIFDGNIMDNICFENKDPNILLKFLHQYGFNQYIDSLPQGIYTPVGENGIKLSGGQRQLISLARALFTNPQILILDEVTSAMDQKMELLVLKILSKIKKEIPILFITHKLQLLHDDSDTICILNDGEISNIGTHTELLQEKDNIYKEYWISRLKEKDT